MAFVLLSGYLLQWAESFKGQLARLGLSCQVSSHCQTQASAILSSALSPNPWSQSFSLSSAHDTSVYSHTQDTRRDSSTPDIGGSCQDVMFHFLTNNQNKLFVSSRLFSQRQPLRAQGAVWRPSHKPVLLISSTSSGALMSPTNIGPRDAFANKSNLKQIQF